MSVTTAQKTTTSFGTAFRRRPVDKGFRGFQSGSRREAGSTLTRFFRYLILLEQRCSQIEARSLNYFSVTMALA